MKACHDYCYMLDVNQNDAWRPTYSALSVQSIYCWQSGSAHRSVKFMPQISCHYNLFLTSVPPALKTTRQHQPATSVFKSSTGNCYFVAADALSLIRIPLQWWREIGAIGARAPAGKVCAPAEEVCQIWLSLLKD